MILDDLVIGVERLVRKISKELWHTIMDVRYIGTMDDVYQEGRLGAVQSAKAFDPDRGVKFATFAAPRIRGSIIDASRKSSLVKIPRLAIERHEEIRYTKTTGNEALLDTPINNTDHPLDVPVAEFLKTLGPLRREIIERHFGLNGRQPETMAAIGKDVGLSPPRMTEIIKDVLTCARQHNSLKEYNRNAA